MRSWRGNPIFCDVKSGRWFYQDDGLLVVDDPNRACGACGRSNTPEGHDGCLGTLPGVMNACCGHGTKGDAYVQFEDGPELRGAAAIAFFQKRSVQDDDDAG